MINNVDQLESALMFNLSDYDDIKTVLLIVEDFIFQNYYTDSETRQLIKNGVTKILKQLDNLHIETRPISPEQQTKFLFYNMAVDDCIKVVRAYLESVNKC